MLGWFSSDPTLMPLHPEDSSARYIALMGGRDAVLAAAKDAGDAGDWRWAAELTSYLVRVDRAAKADGEARGLKAEALRQLGYKTANANWRGCYLTAAQELDGTIDQTRRTNVVAAVAARVARYVKGTPDDAARFFAASDAPSREPVPMAER